MSEQKIIAVVGATGHRAAPWSAPSTLSCRLSARGGGDTLSRRNDPPGGQSSFLKITTKGTHAEGGHMNSKLLAGLAAVGILASGGSVTALAAAAPAAAASSATVASSTSKGAECGPLGPLVAKGTITHAQAIAIHNAFINYARSHWRGVVDTVLTQEVKNHTITKAQASEVNSAITKSVQKFQGRGAGYHRGCHYGHAGSMMGSSGKR